MTVELTFWQMLPNVTKLSIYSNMTHSRRDFSKISSLRLVLCKMTMELTSWEMFPDAKKLSTYSYMTRSRSLFVNSTGNVTSDVVVTLLKKSAPQAVCIEQVVASWLLRNFIGCASWRQDVKQGLLHSLSWGKDPGKENKMPNEPFVQVKCLKSQLATKCTMWNNSRADFWECVLPAVEQRFNRAWCYIRLDWGSDDDDSHRRWNVPSVLSCRWWRYVHTHVHTDTHRNTHTDLHAHTHAHTLTHIHTHTYARAGTHARTNTQLYVCFPRPNKRVLCAFI